MDSNTLTPRPPNLLFILIDDMGWMDLGAYGSEFYETPNLDRLAKDGMTFTDAYASCPVCSPTRASCLTGRYPARVGVTQWIGGHTVGKLQDVPYHHALPLSEVTSASVLRQAGYQTWHVGKWHLGPPQAWPDKHGFDLNVGGCDWGSPKNGYFSPYQIPGFEDGPEGEYLTDRLTEEAIRLIEQRDPSHPFYLNLWPYAVHTPIQAPDDLVEKYREKARRLGLDTQEPFEEGEIFPIIHKRDQRIVQRLFQSDPVYAAMVENLDTNIGHLLKALESAGIAENTLVVFTSDNGGLSTSSECSPTCNAPLHKGKGWMYEGGIREPLIVCWPGKIEAGSKCETPVTSTDFFPTFLDVAGLPQRPDLHIDGVSLMPLLTGTGILDREAIYWHFPHYGNQGDTPGCSIRAGDWKLIEYFEDGRLELYNLQVDIAESKNRAESNPKTTAHLKAMLDVWKESVEAVIPEPNPNWKEV
jgi:arylsulfatase A-like enzyme